MKLATLTGFAALGCSFIATNEASAAYMGLGLRLHTNVTIDGTPRSVWRVYAVFNNPNDYATSVAGSDILGPLTIQSRNSSGFGLGSNFYNPPFGGDLAPATSGGQYVNENSPWDTFATIGVDKNDVNDNADDLTSKSPAFPNFISGNTLTSNNMAWFTPGAVEQGRAGNGFNGTFLNTFGPHFLIQGMGVLLMQLTVNQGHNVQGTIAVGVDLASSLAGGQSIPGQMFSTVFIPAPSAILFFALATRPRRRRM